MNREEVFRTCKLLCNAYELSDPIPPFDPDNEHHAALKQWAVRVHGTPTVKFAWDDFVWRHYYLYRLLRSYSTFRPKIFVSHSGPYKKVIGIELDLCVMCAPNSRYSLFEWEVEEMNYLKKYALIPDPSAIPKVKLCESSRVKTRRVMSDETVQAFKMWKNGLLGVMFDWLDENGIGYEIEKKETKLFVIHVFWEKGVK
jgi:hypothetical protein